MITRETLKNAIYCQAPNCNHETFGNNSKYGKLASTNARYKLENCQKVAIHKGRKSSSCDHKQSEMA